MSLIILRRSRIENGFIANSYILMFRLCTFTSCWFCINKVSCKEDCFVSFSWISIAWARTNSTRTGGWRFLYFLKRARNEEIDIRRIFQWNPHNLLKLVPAVNLTKSEASLSSMQWMSSISSVPKAKNNLKDKSFFTRGQGFKMTCFMFRI